MTTDRHRHLLPGSERQPMADAVPVADTQPDERLEVTVRLRARTPLRPAALQLDALPASRTPMSREAYAATHGADPADVARVAAFATSHGLAVADSSVARRSVTLTGTAAAMSAAFGVRLQQFEHGGGSYRGRTGPVSVPADLAGIVEGVFGLDNRPQAEPHFLRHAAGRRSSPRAAASFTPPELARLYDFPADADGSGQCIAIVELGGGYRPRDLSAYFQGLGLPAPSVKAVLVDHARNQPTTADSADGEVMLDIEVAAAIAPKARIVVYFAPNTDQGFLDAITTAVHDATHRPSVVSISWGGPEASWTAQSLTQFDQAFQAAAAMGVTVCCASGDNGSGDGLADGKPHVDFPASSPHVLGCGGTRLVASGGTVRTEVVWDEGSNGATGGGVSTAFPLPDYQRGAQVPPVAGQRTATGRGVPDVAGVADPATGYKVLVDGQQQVIGGTSAVAPLWAALIALLNQQLGHPVGFLNPLLYGTLAGSGALRDITRGNNGAYAARPGWDACTGWGVPVGSRLLQALQG